MEGCMVRSTKVCRRVVHRIPWLPLATICLVSDNREFEV